MHMYMCAYTYVVLCPKLRSETLDKKQHERTPHKLDGVNGCRDQHGLDHNRGSVQSTIFLKMRCHVIMSSRRTRMANGQCFISGEQFPSKSERRPLGSCKQCLIDARFQLHVVEVSVEDPPRISSLIIQSNNLLDL